MPKSWSEMDERKYKRLRKSLLAKGLSRFVAENRAARIVNAGRRKRKA